MCTIVSYVTSDNPDWLFKLMQIYPAFGCPLN